MVFKIASMIGLIIGLTIGIYFGDMFNAWFYTQVPQATRLTLYFLIGLPIGVITVKRVWKFQDWLDSPQP